MTFEVYLELNLYLTFKPTLYSILSKSRLKWKFSYVILLIVQIAGSKSV